MPAEGDVRPLLLGYQRVRIETKETEVVAGRRALKAFARREGYALGEVFVDRNDNRPMGALLVLVGLARRVGAAAIVVTALSDLGRDPAAQRSMRDRVQRETGVPVLVTPAPTTGTTGGRAR